MRIVLRKSSLVPGHVEIVAVDGDPTRVPATTTYDTEADAIHAVAQYLGVVSNEIEEVVYEG